MKKQQVTQPKPNKAQLSAPKDLAPDGDWIPFNHENPALKPGLYWAVGRRPSEGYSTPKLSVFQILIEIFSDDCELKILPAATVPYLVFENCLAYIAYVQPLMYPLNPFTNKKHEGEYA